MNPAEIARLEREIREADLALRGARLNYAVALRQLTEIGKGLAADFSGFSAGQEIGTALAEGSATGVLWGVGEILLMFPPVKFFRAPNELRKVMGRLKELYAVAMKEAERMAMLDHHLEKLKRELQAARSTVHPTTPPRKPFHMSDGFGEKPHVNGTNGHTNGGHGPGGNGGPGGPVGPGDKWVHIGSHPPPPAPPGFHWVVKDVKHFTIRHERGMPMGPPQKVSKWVLEPTGP